MGYTVLGSGNDSKQTVGDKTRYQIKFERPSFPGSIAIVKGQPARVQSKASPLRCISAAPEAEMAQPYGEQIGKIMSYFTGMFGLPPYANLTVVETEDGAPNGYAAPGHDLPRPARHRQAGRTPSCWPTRSRASGSRSWSRPPRAITCGSRTDSPPIPKCCGAEHETGPAAMESQLRDVMVESLTVDTVPIMQSARLEDYSPELWALTGSKGATVMGMLRYVMGDEKFFKT